MFNPENDIALAAGNAVFTPPKNAAILHRAGAMLPWWLGSEGDGVLVPAGDRDDAAAFASSAEERFGRGPEIASSVNGLSVGRFVPWGWSVDALSQFKRAGATFPASDTERMNRLRQLSHRRVSRVVNQSLYDAAIGEFPPLPREVTNARDISDIERVWGSVYVKAPWSSTGRGVMCSDDMPLDELVRRTEGTIRRQGSVMVEKALDKVVDFAMLFRSDAGRVRFAGYSLFFNGRGSSYGGNLLLTDGEIEHRLSAFVSPGLLRNVADTLCQALTGLVAADYSGDFGVDMMVYAEKTGEFRLAPCVELNLRLTMGVVAHSLTERFRGTGYEKLLVGPASAAADNAFWLVPRNGCYFIGLV